MNTRTADITLTAQTAEGFLVAKVTREAHGNQDPHFAVGADLYASRAAYEAGNENAIIACGCLHDEVAASFPQLAPIIRLHLASAVTGEPMHAIDNARYRLMGGDMLHELEARDVGRHNYYQAPDTYTDEGWLNPAFAAYFLDMAANGLNVGVDELVAESARFGQDPDAFDRWAEGLRQRWQDTADQANAWIDSNATTVDIPAEQDDEDEYTYNGEAGLTVAAELVNDTFDEIGGHYVYSVRIAGPNVKDYVTRFTGSAADYSEGRVNAREAAFGVLNELRDFGECDSAREFAEEMGAKELYEANPVQWNKTHAAAERFEDLLDANAEVIGR